jgi:hypothetical protein
MDRIKNLALGDHRVRLQEFFSNRTNVILTVVILLILVGGIFGVKALLGLNKNQGPLQDVDLAFDPAGPYALLAPRRDGNAINLTITRVLSYDSISYELAYQSNNDAGENLDRGVTGQIKTDNKKNEYLQEVLFGTCSRGNTMDPLHCVFDKGVENGTLTLHIVKDRTRYNMVTTWHFQHPDRALGVLTSGDNHFKYVVQGASESAVLATPTPTSKTTTQKTPTASPTTSGFSDDLRQKLTLIGYTLINDLSGVPKLPTGKQVTSKVYALNVPDGKDFLSGSVKIEVANTPAASAKIAYFKINGSDWKLLDTKVVDSTLSADAPGAGIFAVLTDAPTNNAK